MPGDDVDKQSVAQSNELLIRLSEEDLYRLLGEHLLGGEVEVRGEDSSNRAARGRAWMRRNSRDLALKVCGDEKVRDSAGDRLQELGAVADCVSSIAGKPSAYTVAAILLCWGLEKFCGGFEASKEPHDG